MDKTTSPSPGAIRAARAIWEGGVPSDFDALAALIEAHTDVARITEARNAYHDKFLRAETGAAALADALDWAARALSLAKVHTNARLVRDAYDLVGAALRAHEEGR